jgi:hypothetical protein
MLISLPQGVGEPSSEFEVARNGDALPGTEPAGDKADEWAVR